MDGYTFSITPDGLLCPLQGERNKAGSDLAYEYLISIESLPSVLTN